MAEEKRHKDWNGHGGPVIDSVKGFDVIECNACYFKHIVPIPTLEELDEQYKKEFYSTKKPAYIEKILEDSEWWNFHHNRIYDFLEKNIAGNERRVLSVGCGPAFFLQAGRKRGWAPVGIEPGERAVEYAREQGIDVHGGFFEEVDVSRYGRFDVVHSAHVLEHLPSPQRLIGYAYDNLKEDGIICIVAANEYNKLQNLLKEKMGLDPWWVVPDEHINYFNMESAARLLTKNGFEIIHMEVTFPMELFVVMGQNYVGDSVVGGRCHAMRKGLELNLSGGGLDGLLERLYGFFREEGIGREFIIYGRRSK